MNRSLANQTAIALSNIIQTERVRELYQANVTRTEEERLQLAHALHDRVLNQLAALLMRLDNPSGDFIEYHVTVTNTGTAPAASVVVTDALQVADVTFVSTENTGAAWTSIAFASPTVTATLSGPLAAGGSAEFWIRVQVN